MFSIGIQRHKSAEFVKSTLWLKRWTRLPWYIRMSESQLYLWWIDLRSNVIGQWSLKPHSGLRVLQRGTCANSVYFCFSLASGWARAPTGNVQLCCIYARLWNKCRYEQPLHTNRAREFSPNFDMRHFNCDYRNCPYYRNLCIE